MISRIKNIQGDGHWDSQHGRLYRFEYEFEDGTILKANHKTQTSPFNIGQDAEYEVTKTNEYGKIGKVKKPSEYTQPQGKKDDYWEEKDKKIAIGHAINNAVQITIAMGLNVHATAEWEQKILQWSKRILLISKELNEEGKQPTPQLAANVQKNEDLKPEDPEDDLPF